MLEVTRKFGQHASMDKLEIERRFVPKTPEWRPSGESECITQGIFELGHEAQGVIQYMMGLPLFRLYAPAENDSRLIQHLPVFDGAALFRHAESPRFSMMGMTARLPQGWKARVRSHDGKRHVIDIKGPRNGTTRLEYGAYDLPPAKGAELLAIAPQKQSKTRFYIPHGDQVWHVDVNGPDHPLPVICEVELKSADEALTLPPWVGQEITALKISEIKATPRTKPKPSTRTAD